MIRAAYHNDTITITVDDDSTCQVLDQYGVYQHQPNNFITTSLCLVPNREMSSDRFKIQLK